MIAVYTENDIDKCFGIFLETFMCYFYKNFPPKMYSLDKSKNWVTNEIKNSSQNMKLLFKLFKTDANLSEAYKAAKRPHFALIIKARRSFSKSNYEI